jgi:hypothetical protein
MAAFMSRVLPPRTPEGPDSAAGRTPTLSEAEPALPKIGAPATRALAAIGVTTLDHVVERSESELLALHGVGPRAVRLLKEALASEGMELRR